VIDMSVIEPGSIEPERLRPLRRSEYDRLVAAGVFGRERIELLFGQLVTMSPIDPSHDEAVGTLDELLKAQLGGRARVRVQGSFAASDESEPMPDILVVRNQRYWRDHPDHAYLVIEVSRSSLRKDRGVKAQLYGSVAVEEYWIVDVVGGCVHVLREPDGAGSWRAHRVASRGEVLTVAAFPNVRIPVAEILPPV